MRLDKFLAESSVGKRKDVREYIKMGLVKVNSKVTIIPAIEISEDCDVIEYKNEIVKYSGKVYYMFNKPAGCITARKDKLNKTVFDYFDKEISNGIFHVGRLDKDTEGLLLFTNDGQFEHHLMHPEQHIEKTYFFWALGNLNYGKIRKLENGVYIGQEKILTKPAKVIIGKSGLYKEYINDLFNDLCFEIDKSKENQPVVSGCLTISEGRKHQVKRMLKAVGCKVIYLKRIEIGGVKLDKYLRKGEYRKLNKAEYDELMKD